MYSLGRIMKADPKTVNDSIMAAFPSCGGKKTSPIISLKNPDKDVAIFSLDHESIWQYIFEYVYFE